MTGKSFTGGSTLEAYTPTQMEAILAAKLIATSPRQIAMFLVFLAVVCVLSQMAIHHHTAIVVVAHDEKIIPTFERAHHIRDRRIVDDAARASPSSGQTAQVAMTTLTRQAICAIKLPRRAR